MTTNNWQDTLLRFLIGGSVLVLVYLLAALLPWQSFAGVFAAFPGVMAAAVGLAGWRQGSTVAADVARGSVLGMISGVPCILTTMAIISSTHNWWLALSCAIMVWFTVSIILHSIFTKTRKTVK